MPTPDTAILDGLRAQLAEFPNQIVDRLAELPTFLEKHAERSGVQLQKHADEVTAQVQASSSDLAHQVSQRIDSGLARLFETKKNLDLAINFQSHVSKIGKGERLAALGFMTAFIAAILAIVAVVAFASSFQRTAWVRPS